MRLAVDIGFGFVKGLNDQGDKINFPSVMAKRSEHSLKNIMIGQKDDYSISYSDEKGSKLLYVGDAGMTNGGVRKWQDKSEFNLEELKIFISTAVGYLNKNNEAVDLVVGLPMSYYLQKKDELVNVLKSLDATVKFDDLGFERKINFNSIFCFPQGAGAYYSAVLDINGHTKNVGLATTGVGVIDIGYRTVDFLVMGKGRHGTTVLDSLSGSLEEDGMNKAFQGIEKMVSDKVGREIGLIEIEKAILWFGSKLDYRRETIDLHEYETAAYKDLADSISSKLKIKWGGEADLLSTIIVTGGGGKELYSLLSSEFEQAQLQENSAYANCEGYLGSQALAMRAGVM